jgi:hypothetical protein
LYLSHKLTVAVCIVICKQISRLAVALEWTNYVPTIMLTTAFVKTAFIYVCYVCESILMKHFNVVKCANLYYCVTIFWNNKIEYNFVIAIGMYGHDHGRFHVTRAVWGEKNISLSCTIQLWARLHNMIFETIFEINLFKTGVFLNNKFLYIGSWSFECWWPQLTCVNM